MAGDPLEGVDVDAVSDVRAGNTLWPGLLAFTGMSFLAYLLVKLASGAMAPGPGAWAQIAVSAVLLAYGGWRLKQARYFYVSFRSGGAARRIGGLSKREQTALVARLGGGA